MEFPEREEDIVEFALRIAEWLEQHPDTFPGIPFSAAELRSSVDTFNAAQAASADAEARARESHVATDRSLVQLKKTLKAHLRYVEIEVRGEPERLSGLGWGGRPGATDREPPDEVRDVIATKQGDAAVLLAWRPPVDGGPAAAYRIQRRKRGGTWEFVARAVDNDVLLSGQPCGVEFDLRVVAVNKAGAGQPSAVVTVVL